MPVDAIQPYQIIIMVVFLLLLMVALLLCVLLLWGVVADVFVGAGVVNGVDGRCVAGC